jgi:UDP-2,3-diacylglucosamine pyrophosphatase LpxH
MGMLVFISDLHFVDGSAGEHNTPWRAFDYFFNHITNIATKKSNKGKIKEIKIILLGDIFDLLRTENWFEPIPAEERPWGNKAKETEEHALDILKKVAKHKNPAQGVDNAKALEIIWSRLKKLKEQCKLDYSPELAYIPGNHDRLANQKAYVTLRQKVRQHLGLVQPNIDQPFPHLFFDPDYGVLARHGHEFDRYNYEGGTSFTEQDYQRVPIGDPITTELIARLPYELRRRLQDTTLPPAEKERIVENFQEIENVRPLSAVIEWLLYQVSQTRWLKEIIEDTVDAGIKRFNDLQFVKDWYDRHDKWLNPIDEADKIQAVLYLLEKFKVFPTEKLLSLAIKAHKFFARDDLLEAAPEEFFLDGRVRYVVHGHTHTPLVMPIRNKDSQEHIYLNTGTWRTRYQKSTRDGSFVSWKNMTFLVFYKKEERDADIPTFETWTGTLKVL